MVENSITAKTLRQALQQPGRSQSALARRLGRDPATVTRIVQGKRALRPHEFLVISDYLRETSGDRAATRLPDQDWRERSLHAASFVEFVDRAEATSLEEVLSRGLSTIFQNLESGLGRHLSFPPGWARGTFWAGARKEPYAIVLMGLGAGLLTQNDAEVVAYLARMSARVAASRAPRHPATPLEEDPELTRRLTELLRRTGSADRLKGPNLRKALAVELALIALRALDPAEGEQAISWVRKTYGSKAAAQRQSAKGQRIEGEEA